MLEDDKKKKKKEIEPFLINEKYYEVRSWKERVGRGKNLFVSKHVSSFS